jgi:toxin ParE1/3/4
MAYQLTWSPISRDDLRDIVRFISRDSLQRAQAFALRLIAHVDRLQEQPESGHPVPEFRVAHIRQIIFRPYRIVYRVDHRRKLVEISRVWHAARGTPELPMA